MTLCFFVSDIHGWRERYEKLFREIEIEKPNVLFLGGDLLPANFFSLDFTTDFLIKKFLLLKERLGKDYPTVFLILGNDDPKSEEEDIIGGEALGLWVYLHNRKSNVGEYEIYGYSYVPPTPFLLKDWERFDVSRFVDVGSVSPLEGRRTFPTEEREIRTATIKDDLDQLVHNADVSKSIFLFHAPPYQTNLDRANLDQKMVEYAPMDVHVGSIAIKRFIETKQPYITLHGHVHESSSVTGQWREKIGSTHLFSAAYDGPELAIVKFYLEEPSSAYRIIK